MNEEKQNITPEDFYRIMLTQRPNLMSHLNEEAVLFYECEHNIFREHSYEEDVYWDTDELIMAKAIISDYGDKFANKVGRILVAATTN